MNISAKRFKGEWEFYKEYHHYSSAQQILNENNVTHYRYEDISRFKNGQRKLQEDDLEFFSKLFNIRKEYLSGIDPYRTEEDRINALKRKKNISTAFHQILVALGYADLNMEEDDYNFTFPENTYYFLEGFKEPLKKEGVTVICDVNKDEYIAMEDGAYNSFISDVIDYIEFKISKEFLNSEPIPDVILDDNSTPLHPKTYLKLNNGGILECEKKYTPTSQLNDKTLNNTFIITEHPPTVD